MAIFVKRFFSPAFLLIAFSYFSGASAHTLLHSGIYNIYGNDHRVVMERREMPLSAIGYLATAMGHCTATLVARDWVLTAAHCVVNREKRAVELDGVLFIPNVHHGSSSEVAAVTEAIVGGTDVEGALANRLYDWALLKLGSPLGDRFGVLPLQPSGGAELVARGPRLGLFGYPDDIEDGGTLVKQLGCSIRAVSVRGVLLHDCDSAPGQSGGPIIDTATGQIVALNNGQISPIAAPVLGSSLGNEGDSCSARNRTLRGIDYSERTSNFAAPLQAAQSALERRLGR